MTWVQFDFRLGAVSEKCTTQPCHGHFWELDGWLGPQEEGRTAILRLNSWVLVSCIYNRSFFNWRVSGAMEFTIRFPGCVVKAKPSAAVTEWGWMLARVPEADWFCVEVVSGEAGTTYLLCLQSLTNLLWPRQTLYPERRLTPGPTSLSPWKR